MFTSNKVIALLLAGVLSPNLVGHSPLRPTATPVQEDAEVTGEDKLFVKKLHARLVAALAQQRSVSADPYNEILKRERDVRTALAEKQKERAAAEQDLKLKTAQARELKELLDKTFTLETSRQLEQAKRARAETALKVTTLKQDEQAIKRILRVELASSYSSKKKLGAEINRADEQQSELLYKYIDWDRGRGDYKQHVEFRTYLLRKAAAAGFRCSVRLISKKNGKETPGATIKYQTPTQRRSNDVMTAKCQTACVEEMDAGQYYIWTERWNSRTSEIRLVYLADANDMVEIEENFLQ